MPPKKKNVRFQIIIEPKINGKKSGESIISMELPQDKIDKLPQYLNDWGFELEYLLARFGIEGVEISIDSGISAISPPKPRKKIYTRKKIRSGKKKSKTST
jgi:hypothetical protein